MSCFPALLAYIGPETIVPLGSALAAIGGVVMIFWNSIRQAVARCFSRRDRENSGS